MTDTKGQDWKGYEYHELDTSNIVIGGNIYSYDKMPDNIKMTSDKIIEFHYKLKPATLVTREFLVKELNGKIFGVEQISQNNGKTKKEKQRAK